MHSFGPASATDFRAYSVGYGITIGHGNTVGCANAVGRGFTVGCIVCVLVVECTNVHRFRAKLRRLVYRDVFEHGRGHRRRDEFIDERTPSR